MKILLVNARIVELNDRITSTMKKNNSLSECNGNTLSHKINNFSSSKNNNIMVIDDEIHHDGLPKKQLIKLILDSLDSMGYKYVKTS